MTRPVDGKAAGGPDPAEFDRDLDLRGVLSFGIGLALTMIVVLGMVWLLLAFWKERQIARDPGPSPIAGANVPRPPPEPRLQSSPVRDMEELRAREDSVLTTYGWVDRREGIARIPIDRAIEVLLEKGLSSPPPAPSEKKMRPRRAGGKRSAAPASGGGAS
jgi:hypothetical protein